ncbi:Glycosyl transferase family 2 [Enhydrobacter aerosaccus]|uniref:Glycosyl transferase family 2 n=1 Tax=Enhydrobacter aerosaccus TaxID=225324 RepID=A0A1T4KIE3_9HYPH|nr:glycosyltransferase family 2 protein [Enhydrobacter aerosaccus]SJZ42156.1 Glycosyl transferase family 2 [Enhydrobacter aerosaccus]
MGTAKLPRVGVVIANHNNESYVADAIASAARQTVRNIEVIVVDDASTDGSDKIIRDTLARMSDPRFRYVRLEKNCGQTGAIRRGVAELRAPFVCFLDSDDVWYENFVERHLAAHLNADFPVAFTYCDSHFINGDGELLAGTAWWFELPPNHELHRPIEPDAAPAIDAASGQARFPANPMMTLHGHWTPTWSSNSTAAMMFRRDIIELVLPDNDEQLRLYLDFYLSTFCILIVGCIAVHEALYAYRMHGKNKHSDGLMLGGASQTSRKNWAPISESVFNLILNVMLERRDALTGAIGTMRYEQAVKTLHFAMSQSRRPPWLARLLALLNKR